MGSKINFTEHQVIQIINDYNSGISIQKMSNQLNCCGQVIKKILENNNVIFRESTDFNKKYIIDEHYFDYINSEEKAYFLGFIFANSCLSKSSNRLTIKLAIQDKEILEKFKNIIFKSEYILKATENNYSLQFSGKFIKQSLLKLGYRSKFPNLKSNLNRHFIRGYFDGSGSFFNNNDAFRLHITAEDSFCFYIQNIINQELQVENFINKLSRDNVSSSSLDIGKNKEVLKFTNWLYNDATIFLKRKHDVYLELKLHRENIEKEIIEKEYKLSLQINNIINLYNSGKTLEYISNDLQMSISYIYEKLINNNVDIRKSQKYHNNHTYFDNIDTEDKAYFLGFLFADGNVSSNGNEICLGLHTKDKAILEKFQTFVYHENEQRLYGDEIRHNVRFSSPHMKQALINLGCTPRKSLILKFPNIDPKLLNHFIRGYFDGDGCICGDYGDDYGFNFLSTENFCKTAQQEIAKQLDVKTSYKIIEDMNGITSKFNVRGNRRILKFCNWMYKDAIHFLERKHAKYLDLVKTCQDVDERKIARHNAFLDRENARNLIIQQNKVTKQCTLDLIMVEKNKMLQQEVLVKQNILNEKLKIELDIIDFYQAGCSSREVGKLFGVDKKTVTNILYKHNLKPRASK